MQLHFLASDFPPAVGGIQKLTYGLARALGELGEEVQVLAAAQPGDQEFDARSGVPTIRCGSRSRLGAAIALGGALRRVVADGEGDGIVVATKWSPEGHAYLVPGAGRAAPMVLMGYGREFRPERQRRLRGLAQRVVLRAARGGVVISRYTKGQMLAAGLAEDRIRIVPPAIDPADLVPPTDLSETAGQLGWPEGPTLLTVARLVRRKGVDCVIEALPRIAAVVPDIAYVVLGDGPERDRLVELSWRMGVEGRVHFLGAASDEQKAACLHLCDVFVMPSRDIPAEPPEGFGIVYLEANACGKPVIAARTGGVEDAVEDGVNGLLVEPDSPDQVAEAALRLLTQPADAQAIGSRGRARVLQRFVWEVVAPQFVQAIRSLA